MEHISKQKTYVQYLLNYEWVINVQEKGHKLFGENKY